MKDNNNIGSLIRERYGSIKSFADKIDIPYTTIDTMLKRGFLNSNTKNAMKVCNELGIDIDELRNDDVVSKPNDSLGSLLKQRRKEKGYTLEQVGNYIGVSKTTVFHWESGEIENMKRNKIDALCNILDISPSLFIKGIVDENEKTTFTRKEYKVKVINMTNNCTELSEEEKKMIISIMNVL